MINSTGINKR